MYQLVKKNKKSILVKLLIFLVVASLIREAIRINTAPPPISQQLNDFVNSLNKRCPMIIDSTLILNNCVAIAGNRLHFNYQASKLSKDEVDTVSLMLDNRQQIINGIRTNPDMAVFKQNELYLTATYYDKTGNYICGVAVTPADYKE
jgi:hypothetical protein